MEHRIVEIITNEYLYAAIGAYFFSLICFELRIKSRFVCAFPAWAYALCFYGLRSFTSGTDTERYYLVYKGIAPGIADKLEPGFRFFLISAKQFDISYHIVLLAVVILQMIPLTLLVRHFFREERYFGVVLVALVSSATIVDFMTNAMRQGLGVLWGLYLLTWLDKRDVSRKMSVIYLLLCALLVHRTVLVHAFTALSSKCMRMREGLFLLVKTIYVFLSLWALLSNFGFDFRPGIYLIKVLDAVSVTSGLANKLEMLTIVRSEVLSGLYLLWYFIVGLLSLLVAERYWKVMRTRSSAAFYIITAIGSVLFALFVLDAYSYRFLYLFLPVIPIMYVKIGLPKIEAYTTPLIRSSVLMILTIPIVMFSTRTIGLNFGTF